MSETFSSAGFSPKIAAVCQIHPVTLGYLFGSHARGTADAESDIDVAILADPKLSSRARQELRFRLMRELAEALSISMERVDVIILQDVPTLLQYNVIRTGRLLFGNAAPRRVFEVVTEQRYLEEAAALDRDATLTLDRILAHVR